MAARKTSSEWDRIQLEYLAGEDSIREIADRFDVSESNIRRRAKEGGWERALKKRQRAQERAVSHAERQATPAAAPPAPDTAAIGERGRELIARMMGELDTVTAQPGEFELLIEDACEGDDDGKRRAALEKAVTLGSRADVMKTLATALKTLNEASAPQGKKAAAQQRASAVGAAGGRFGAMPPPGSGKLVN